LNAFREVEIALSTKACWGTVGYQRARTRIAKRQCGFGRIK